MRKKHILVSGLAFLLVLLLASFCLAQQNTTLIPQDSDHIFFKNKTHVHVASSTVDEQTGEIVLNNVKFTWQPKRVAEIQTLQVVADPSYVNAFVTNKTLPTDNLNFKQILIAGLKFDDGQGSTVTIDKLLFEDGVFVGEFIKKFFNGTLEEINTDDHVSKCKNFTLLNLKAKLPQDKKDPLHCGIGKILIADNTNDHVSKFVIENLDFHDQEVKFVVEKTSIDNVNYPEAYRKLLSDDEIEKQLQLPNGVQNILTTLFLGDKPLVETVLLANMRITADNYLFTAGDMGFKTKNHNRLDLWLKGLELENIDQLGVQHPKNLAVNIQLGANVSPVDLVVDGKLALGNLWNLSIKVTPLIAEAAIKDLLVKMEDNGALAWLALNFSKPGQIDADITSILSDVEKSVGNDANAKVFMEALRTFLKKPGSLEMRSRYGEPIKLDQLETLLAKPADNFVLTATEGSAPLEEQVQKLAPAQTK
ncbi:MAG: hypothetical protein IJU79_03310 [Desulfovibrionaceae bacterium]|nr:hypothetical protein [Desulfovibrionaceae bacterium]